MYIAFRKSVVYSVVFGAVSVLSADRLEASCEEQIADISTSEWMPTEKLGALITGPGSKCADTATYKLEMGSNYIALEEYSKAREYFDTVIREFGSREHEALLGIGNIYLHKNEYDNAIEFYSQVVDKSPYWDRGYESLGTAYVVNGEYKSAIDILSKGLQINNKNVHIYRYLGFAYYYQSRPELAIENFNKAFALRKETLSDKYVMIAASRSYVEVDKIEVAESLLGILSSNVPGIEKDNDFRLVVKYLADHQTK